MENPGFNRYHPPKKPSINREKGVSRRDFLKTSGKILGAVAAGAALGGALSNLPKLWEGEETAENVPTQKQAEIKEDDVETIVESTEDQLEELPDLKEILAYEYEGEIVLDEMMVKKIEMIWSRRYRRGGDLHLGLRSAYQRMQPWMDLIRPHFKKAAHNLCGETYQIDPKELEKFVYLCIPESHFQTNAVSCAGAKGPYQFIAQTARSCGLRVGNVIDERFDPEKSAAACAANLAYLFSVCKDWDLAASGYNGGFIWAYLKTKKAGERNYLDFLKFIAQKTNETKNLLKNQTHYEYFIKEDDSLSRIAKRFFLDPKEIKRYNGISINSLRIGQRLKIPLKNQAHRKKVYNSLIAFNGLIENLNYPAKFNAVFKLIQEGAVEDLKSNRRLAFTKEIIAPSKVLIHEVKKGETLYSIKKKYSGISVADLKIWNKLKSDIISLGQKLEIKKGPRTSLKNLAIDSNHLKKLITANPSVISKEGILPPGTVIRMI